MNTTIKNKKISDSIHKILPRVFAVFIAFLAVHAISSPAKAELKIDINGGHSAPLPIAIPEFTGSTLEDIQYGKMIASVVSDNLKRSGLFDPVDEKAFIETLPSINTKPTFTNWQIINAQALVQGRIITDATTVKVEFRLWDVFASKQLEGRALVSEKDNWRRIGHLVSDAIYERITGETGYFDTRIVYIAESSEQLNKRKRLSIMDQDGANHKYLTDGRALVLTPRFSPTAQEITYLSYKNGTPQVYIFNLETGSNRLLGNFPGMTFAPRFSPDGKKVIMSMAVNGNSEIYEMTISSKTMRKLTNHPSIDTSPSFSPDGKQVVFNSDRGGSQQIYVMDSSGANPHRISFGDGRYATPVWSPRGDYIAFTKIKHGEFFIGVIQPSGDGERLLARGYLAEGPTWSPNGRVLMFYKQYPSDKRGVGARARLYTVDVTGYNERQVITPTDASDPAWSPLLP
ncbi:MAG: Tol-Pal system protein TolB [Alphaproteobacteria bacterium]|nr:Tol-Pal system protein TolB [Alphaproteobacteria bacterium]